MKHNSFIILLALVSASYGYICERTPKKAVNPRPNIDRYVIEIEGTPESYSQSQTYKVVLKSNPQNPITNFFHEFIIVVEPQDPSVEVGSVSIGELKPVDQSIGRFTSICPSAIVQTNNLAKSKVEVFWTAPSSGNGCISIKATVYESIDSWYTDDGGLTKTICEEDENKDEQPEFFEDCCACDEAKYEIAFQGMWTRNTHPQDYPANMWTTKLGEIIGASHKHSKSFWSYESTASEGLKLLAEEGQTSELENELKELIKSEDIRTIIKARELSYPNLTGTSYTVFRVDQDHHLISLVSKITPSPDWIVGVANLELCTRSCEWIASRTLNLYPWDAGTDKGTSYNSADDPIDSPEIVKKIGSHMEDYPFYNKDGEPIKPIAELKITRQKLYEKRCNESDSDQSENEECKLTEWSNWSLCSSTCGNEVMTRDRQLEHPDNEEQCTKDGPLELQETIKCPPSSAECEPTECVNATWADWSSCNTTCGTGYKTRYGKLSEEPTDKENKEEEDEEEHQCEETVNCMMPDCDETTTDENSDSLSIHSQTINQMPTGPVDDCKVSDWSDWGACSATEPCSRGYKFRERHIIIHPRNGGAPCPKKLLKKRHCRVPCSEDRRPEPETNETDCQLGPWTAWTPCSKNCGNSAFQVRTRAIEVYPSRGGKPCGPRTEKRKCSLPFACSDPEAPDFSKQ